MRNTLRILTVAVIIGVAATSGTASAEPPPADLAIELTPIHGGHGVVPELEPCFNPGGCEPEGPVIFEIDPDVLCELVECPEEPAEEPEEEPEAPAEEEPEAPAEEEPVEPEPPAVEEPAEQPVEPEAPADEPPVEEAAAPVAAETVDPTGADAAAGQSADEAPAQAFGDTATPPAAGLDQNLVLAIIGGLAALNALGLVVVGIRRRTDR